MECNFFAILFDGTVRKINLIRKITKSVKDIFIEHGNSILEDTEEIEFNGNYVIEDDQVLFVNLALPRELDAVASDPIGIEDLDLNTEKVKAIFWYEDGVYYFQNFDARKLLTNRNVIVYDRQTYTKLEGSAFIIENIVHAIHKDGKLYFKNYINANKIFSLSEFYQAATNQDIKVFSAQKAVSLDQNWFLENSNSVIRKQITLIQKSGILDKANTKKIRSSAKRFKLSIDLDDDGKIVFPNDKKECRKILVFLNEQYYRGLITGTNYITSSKRIA